MRQVEMSGVGQGIGGPLVSWPWAYEKARRKHL